MEIEDNVPKEMNMGNAKPIDRRIVRYDKNGNAKDTITEYNYSVGKTNDTTPTKPK